MNSLNNKIVLITGASSGIGMACARLYAAQGANLILTARRADRIQALATELEKNHKIATQQLIFDITNKKAIKDSIAKLDPAWRKIDILVNNAGLALSTDLIQEGSTDDWDTMIDTNIKGLLYMTREILPLMLPDNSGHIVNIGSIAGLEQTRRGNVYCATKHAVHALNKSMRIDLYDTNIRVTEINPGAVSTEFSSVRLKGDKEKSAAFYANIYSLNADNIADAVIYATSRAANINIEQIVLTAVGQASLNYRVQKNGEEGGAFDK